jgi:hypothetical protein
LDGSSEKLEMARFGLVSQSELDSDRIEAVENEADEGLPEGILYNSWDAEPLGCVGW